MCPKKALTVFIGILLSVAGMVSTLFGAETKGGGAMELKSSAFQSGAEIPRKYTCDANDVSPSLSWDKMPAGTKAFALIADDPDAPVGIWVHWVLYDLPAEMKELPLGVITPTPELPFGTIFSSSRELAWFPNAVWTFCSVSAMSTLPPG